MPARDANLNALWCRCIVEELVRGGVQHALLCPGSRNCPLIFACAAEAARASSAGDATPLQLISQVDERSAGFVALGLATATRRPVVVCVTSGSALANLLPAVVEAHAAGMALVVVAADRPWEAHGVGAPQTMRQRDIFAPFLVHEVALVEPVAEDLVLRSLRARISRALQALPGPLLINVPMRDPLPPIPDGRYQAPVIEAEALLGRPPLPYTVAVRPQAARSTLPAPQLDYLRPGLRGLIVVGASAVGDPAPIRDFALSTGYPVIADAPSGLRRDAMPVITTADALLSGEFAQHDLELVIQIGCAPLARSVYEYLGRQRCPWLSLEAGENRDVAARAWSVISQPDASVYADLARRCGAGHVTWRERWLSAEHLALTALQRRMREEPWGEVLAAHLTCTHQGFRFLHLASSMAVRHGNLHCRSDQARAIHANRGLNGIDGTISSFLGENCGLGGGGLLLCGDLAFLHDVGALALVASAPPALAARLHGAIVVINNGGGGIFDFLAVSQVPDWQRYVRTPQSHDLAAAAAQFHCPHVRVSDAPALTTALTQAAKGEGLTVIECLVAAGCVERQRALIAVMAAGRS